MLGRNRGTGSLVVGLFALLTATGYALYYLVGDGTHALVSTAHWGMGLAVAPMLVAHVVMGRRGRTR
jgi:hypothetical protein